MLLPSGATGAIRDTVSVSWVRPRALEAVGAALDCTGMTEEEEGAEQSRKRRDGERHEHRVQ